MNTTKLFVYGSMTEGMVHFSRIQDFILSIEAGTVRGSLYRLKSGYPAFTLEGLDTVQGQVVEIKSSDILLSLLDQFYGFNQFEPKKSMHIRVKTFIQTAGGVESAWVYVLNQEKKHPGLEYIQNGDWQASLSAKPPLVEQLSERQKSYILKLGGCSGRDIIPIDLPLYRELMNLELIVDKGRRLALSKLGLELFRHMQ